MTGLFSLFPANMFSDDVLLVLSVLVFAALLVTKVGYRFGIPTLLLFLAVGMLFGQDGFGLEFNNFEYAQFIGNVALTVILLTGGMETDIRNIKPVLKQGIILSTAGVLLTAVLTGGFIFLISRWMPEALPFGVLGCFLLAAAMSSTDSASVFSILRGNKMRLKGNLDHTLELESGSNDPMAYVLTILLVQVIATMQFPDSATFDQGLTRQLILVSSLTLLLQIVVGAGLGIAFGFLSRWLIKKVDLKGSPLHAIMIVSIGFFTNSFATVLKGNGLLAVYVAAIIIGNDPKFPYKKDIMKFHDGLTWLVQLIMFLLLGLLVNPSELPAVAIPALLIALFMSWVARPLAVFSLTAPFKSMSNRGRAFISWVGLKGAAPILFSIYPVVVGIPGAKAMFNIVFFTTLISLLMQGMTLAKVAKWLDVDDITPPEVETFGIEIPDEMGMLSDTVIKKNDPENGTAIRDINMPEGKRIVMIKRQDSFIVPDGNVILAEGDKLLILEYETEAEEIPQAPI